MATTTWPDGNAGSEAPDRTLDQRMEALKNANVIRSARAQFKRDLKAGRKHAVDVLTSVPAYLETMKVYDMLLNMPRIGRVKAQKILRVHRISPAKTIGGLSDRQRAELVGALRVYDHEGRWTW